MKGCDDSCTSAQILDLSIQSPMADLLSASRPQMQHTTIALSSCDAALHILRLPTSCPKVDGTVEPQKVQVPGQHTRPI